MSEGAIREDVSKEVAGQTLSPREQALEALAATRNEESAWEREESQDEVDAEEAAGESAEDAAVPMVELTDQHGKTYKVPASARYRAKIDGEEVEESLDNITRRYQKGAAADRRLEEATRKHREIEQRESELTRREQEYLAGMKKIEGQLSAGDLSADGYKQKAKKFLAALTEADDTEVALEEVMREMVPDEEKLLAKAEARVWEKITEKERQRQNAMADKARVDANARFAEEYKDVIEDPLAYRAAKNLAAEKWQETPTADPWDIAKAVGEEVRGWRKRTLPATARPKTTPPSISGRASIGQDEKPETRYDVISEMKKQRGQPL